MKVPGFSKLVYLSLLPGYYVKAFNHSPSLMNHHQKFASRLSSKMMRNPVLSRFANFDCATRKGSYKKTTLSMAEKDKDDLTHINESRATILGEEANVVNCENTEFDLIVVGSGNGACGFLAECQKYVPPDYKILVLEEGENYFYISDVTHQNNWCKIYSSGRLFRLHNTRTSDGRPIISGRANAMGGGGTINYTMIHETSKWLAENIGPDSKYFDNIKHELNYKFNLPNVFSTKTEFGKVIESKALQSGYFAPDKDDFIGQIPSLKDDPSQFPSNIKDSKQFYIFPTQFNEYGQRTKSGVSLVDWDKINLKCNTKVKEICMDKATSSICKGVTVMNGKTNEEERYSLKKGGRLVLACGSQSPRLLMRTSGVNKNEKIGKRINDHICMPLGIYTVPKNEASIITAKDTYEPVFTSSVVDPETENNVESSKKEVVFFDYFSGEIERLIFLASSLYLCYIPLNSLKRLMGRYPILFTFLSNSLRVIFIVFVYIYKLLQGAINVIVGKPFSQSDIVITTSLVKFNCVSEGEYEVGEDELITLKFFEDEDDAKIAEKAIKDNLDLLGKIGEKPFFLFRILFQLLTGVPYKETEVKKYVRRFRKRSLLSEQHLAGGCIFGDVIDKGIEKPSHTGKVIGSENIHVADLSTVPLPRCSTQMTAYLVGHHVGKQLYSPEGSKSEK
jgi:hypothetical protein